MLKQNWMAALEKMGWRPRLPVTGAYHCRSLSNQTVSDLRALSEAVVAGPVRRLVFAPEALALTNWGGFVQQSR